MLQSSLNLGRVRQLLARLKADWKSYSPILQNRLLQIFLESVEVVSNPKTLEATIIWKAGLHQKLVIERPPKYGLERIWTDEEKEVLQALWPTATRSEIEAAIPRKSWRAMGLMARRLKVGDLGLVPIRVTGALALGRDV